MTARKSQHRNSLLIWCTHQLTPWHTHAHKLTFTIWT